MTLMNTAYEAVIGLEVHVHLKTRTKAFCGCATEFGNTPNSQTCPVCLGLPGSLPVLNQVALDYALKVGLALNCQIQGYTKFDRKNYFYPDLPKNYQISQYDLPLARDGFLDIDSADAIRRIKIRRVHLEEDAGKLIHREQVSLVDFNRTGIPLLEIVTEPCIDSPAQAQEYLNALKSTIEYLEVSDCDMEKGSLRCDANVSVRRKGAQELGVKTELKNMNSFKAVKDALGYEIDRQIGKLEAGEEIVQETRLWDEKAQESISMRTKEEAQDYRYFPDPDLPPFIINNDKVDSLKRALPELPRQKMLRFMQTYNLSDYDAKILVFLKADAEYAEECLKVYRQADKKPMANLLIGPLMAEANARNCQLSALGVPPVNLAQLLDFIEGQKISYLSAKAVLKEMIDSAGSAAQIISSKNLAQISDTKELETRVEEAIKENASSVQAYKQGKANAIMFLVGQIMKKTAGKANPKKVQEILKRRLSDA